MAQDLHQAGYQVVVSYRTKKPYHLQLSQTGIHLIQADFACQQGIACFIEQIRSQYSGLRAIIHNASDWAAESAEHAPDELMHRMMQIHVQAPYQLNLALADLLGQEGRAGDIIHMTDYVQEKGSRKHIAYAASKAALHNLTLSFSAKLAPHVKVNSIAPALVMFNADDSQQYKQNALQKSLLQICPGAGEVVEAVNYLLQSRYITGRTLHLDGGRHLK